jgi:hypothetical protein
VTLNDLIGLTLNDLGVLGAGEVPAAEDATLALSIINDWIDGLKTEGLSVYTITRTTWTLVPSQASYTVGTGGQVAIDRPVAAKDIQNIGYVDNSLTPAAEYLQGPCLTEDMYAGITNKTLTATIPRFWYYNPTFGATGRGTLSPWPIPTGASLLGVIYAPTPVSEFAAVTDTLSLPPGYRRFLRKQLAIELAPAFKVQVTQVMKDAANESKANIKRANQRLVDVSMGELGSMFGSSAPWDVYSDS